MNLIARARNILVAPRSEWPVIEPEPTTLGQLMTGYVLPLSVVAAVIALLRYSVIGMHMPFGPTVRAPFSTGLTMALYSVISGVAGVLLIGGVINVLAPTFGGTRDYRQACKTAAYTFTCGWLGSVLGLLPMLATLLSLLVAIYGIYVLYLGLPVLMRSPKERAAGYTATVILCSIVLFVLAGILMGSGRFDHMPGMMGYGSRHASERDAAQTAGNILGGMLGTDQKGKDHLGAAFDNMTQAARSQQSAGAAGDATPVPGTTPGTLAATGGLLTAVGGALGGSHPVNVADANALTALLPDALPGMKRASAKGKTESVMGVSASSAEGNYVGEDGAAIQVSITDMAGVSGLMDAASSLIKTSTSQSDSGFEKDVTLSGRTVHEKYDAKARHGELGVLLAKRYQVDVTGENTAMPALEQALGQIDLARLEAMKDAGGPKT